MGTPSEEVVVHFTGRALHAGLQCVLTTSDAEFEEENFEVPIMDLLYSPGGDKDRASCVFADGRLFFRKRTSNATLILRDYNA